MSEAPQSATGGRADLLPSTKKDGSKNSSRRGSLQSNHSMRSASTKGGHEEPIIPDLLAKDNPAADWRNMRRIIAEDDEWTLATVPQLTELCVQHIVRNFENNSEILNKLLLKHQAKVLAKIATKLPLKITALLVDDEGYWKRCCQERWEVCDVSEYGNCWKRMFFERNLQRIIEMFVPGKTDDTELNDTVALSATFVKKMDIRQLLPPVKEAPKGPDFYSDDISDTGSDNGEELELDHFDFQPILKKLHNLEELHVTYGVRDCGMNFEWNLFQFTARDCFQLSQAVASYKTLKVFHLHGSKVDDEKVRVLISLILDHPGLVELDLSHNLIGERGARAIGKFLNNHSRLVRLILSDNYIHAAGAQALAHALTKNTTLKHLNLRLNRIGDEGGQAVCRALFRNSTLMELNLCGNDVGEPTAAVLSQVMMQNSILKSIDLSCNKLGPDGGKQLQEGMEENKTILEMDLRLTECGQESEYCINQILHRNREAARSAIIQQKQANVLSQKNYTEPQAAHRYKASPQQV